MIKLSRKIITIVTAFMIIACSSTDNQSQSVIDGFSENLVNEKENHYRVIYEGPQWINKSDAEAQKVVDYSLLRSAELSLENNFPFFVILSNDSETREIIRDDPICNLNKKNDINKRKCMRYKSIGDLTSVFLKEPLEVELGNIVSNGEYKGKTLFASTSVYRVLVRKYNLNRRYFGTQTEGSIVTSVDNWHEIMNDLERPNID